MRFICETCRANLTIADEKLRGKRLIVRCKRCGVQIRIADPALEAAPPRPRREARAVPPPPPHEASASDAELWFAVVGKKQAGPLSDEEVRSRIAAGEIRSSTYLWKQGMDSWARAQTIDGLAALFAAPPPLPGESDPDPTPAASPDGDEAVERPPAKPDLPFDSSTRPPARAGGEALDLARWGAEELSKLRVETPIPALPNEKQARPSKPEFRVGQSQRRGPLRAALLVLGVAAVLSLAAFAILYERREATHPPQEVAQSSAPASDVEAPPKAPAPGATAASAAVEGPAHGTVPSPDVLKKKVDESMPALQGCVDEAVQREPGLRVGKILILTTVAPSGEITSTRIDKKNVDQSALGACLKDAARNIRFPSFNGEAFPLDIPVVVAGGK